MILYGEILQEFQKQKVRYVLVGGMAVNLLGFQRSTGDMDILVEMSDENLGKIVSILNKQGYKVKQPVDPMGMANKKIRTDWIQNKNMKAFNFYKEKEMKEVDIIVESPIKFAAANKDRVRIKIGSLTIPVISIKNLIKMKKTTGRSLDRFDIESLTKLSKIKKA